MISFHNREETLALVNDLARQRIEFFTVISFCGNKNLVLPVTEWNRFPFAFSFPEREHIPSTFRQIAQVAQIVNFQLPRASEYQAAFDAVQYHLNRGDSYLLNLTFEIPIRLQGDLEQVFCSVRAPYRICLPAYFCCFSPESFVKIKDNKISTFPMKGTIDASVPNAREKLLADAKETAEHYTIVDLLRNDLSQIATHTNVARFRYIEAIRREESELLQMSSEIHATLDPNWQDHFGDLLFRLLPAGSISGAPKKKTIEIISACETHDREWYTGIAGWYREGAWDSCVLIRYIGQRGGRFYYKSGGGITTQSNRENEYRELQDKIYLPTA